MLILLFVACTGDGTKDAGLDADADGYVALTDGGDDCDDADADVHPGATEVCDAANVDEDCDGLADDADAHAGGTLAWPDVDGDGYGTGDGATLCDPTAADAPAGEDCDDTRADVYPGGTEVCDDADADEDCDGTADNEDTSSAPDTRQVVYVDGDGDTYGAGVAGTRCDPEAGESLDGTDCDDADAAVHPGATEVCDDADVDENCNDLEDDGDPTLDPASGVEVYDDDDGDGYGAGVAHPACEPGRGEVLVDGDCDDTDPALSAADEDEDGASPCDGDCNDRDARQSPSLTEVCDDVDRDEDCDGLADDADSSVDVGTMSAWYPDGDGDGYGTGATYAACDAAGAGAAATGDCDDTDATLTPADDDADGLSTCDGDCNDRSARLNPYDEDGDGLSSCDGDCDDTDPTTTSEGCAYTSMLGAWELTFPCVFTTTGTAAIDLSLCPDCEFAFNTENTRVSGDCIDTAQMFMGFDVDAGSLSFQLSFYGSAYSELGPFPAGVAEGAGYDILTFSGTSPYGYTYSGEFFLY